jgi:hypothetical protein
MTTLLIGAFSFVFADEAKELSLNSHQTHATKETVPHQVPSGRVDNPLIGFFSLDLLCWTGQNSDWVVALDNKAHTGTFQLDNYIRGEAKWKPGFKVTLGISKVYDWVVDGTWTYYYNKSRWMSHRSTLNTIFPAIVNLSSMILAQSKMRLDYQTWDINLGTQCRLNPSSTFTPFAGLRGSYIKNNMTTDYQGFDAQDNEVQIILTLPNHFLGWGPRIGASANYQLGKSGVEFFGLLSASLLYGKAKTRQIWYESDWDDGNTFDVKDNIHDLKLGLQGLIGVQYRAVLDYGKKAFSVRFAWEANYWIDKANYYAFTPYISERDLILYGANFGLVYEY